DTPEHATLIKRPQCQALAAFSRSDHEHPSAGEVIAVHVLTHESMHMAGIRNESAAECAALQRDARTVTLLGASPQAAVALARSYWTVDYPRMSDDYSSAQCRPGGPMDEHL